MKRSKTIFKVPGIHPLIHEAQLGNAAAFEKIYQRHKGQVYGLCFRMTKSRSDAEDLTQEVFIQAQRKLHGFRGESAFGTWLYKVAFNIAMMFLRRRCIEEPLSDLTKVERGSSRGMLPPPFFGYAPIRYLALKRAISALPAGRRNVVIMHDVNGLTHHEVGRQLGIAPATSKAQLHHAHVSLRSFLEGNTDSHIRRTVRQGAIRTPAQCA